MRHQVLFSKENLKELEGRKIYYLQKILEENTDHSDKEAKIQANLKPVSIDSKSCGLFSKIKILHDLAKVIATQAILARIILRMEMRSSIQPLLQFGLANMA
jgi:hypothetical protein